eukprot:CAMPEP_0115842314 /NCGR_PEP_ID=MMETSP0287-20121206/7738_1 /TAXON_ID=412157 /ORGANISM="Chrysochromulina rotalis, Strain UIO044" /LENGTH=116 /DNA_ID=CAMNT_0003295983 /DNA_START=121 /DNA_END=471 /DNA_ORIENTATION=-
MKATSSGTMYTRRSEVLISNAKIRNTMPMKKTNVPIKCIGPAMDIIVEFSRMTARTLCSGVCARNTVITVIWHIGTKKRIDDVSIVALDMLCSMLLSSTSSVGIPYEKAATPISPP